MSRCRNCGAEHTVEELRRHERDGIVLVHCPDCGHLLGTYNRHSR